MGFVYKQCEITSLFCQKWCEIVRPLPYLTYEEWRVPLALTQVYVFRRFNLFNSEVICNQSLCGVYQSYLPRMSLITQGIGLEPHFDNSNSSSPTTSSKYFNTGTVHLAERRIRKRRANSKDLSLEKEYEDNCVKTVKSDVENKAVLSQSSVVEEDSKQNTFLSNRIIPYKPQCYGDQFYNVPCQELARALLGKILVRRLDKDLVLKGRIVETECYLGGVDKASHSCGGKMTARNAPMFMKPGTAYVYLTYGMYHCFNISSQGEGAAVLVRALEPLEGLTFMSEQRLRGVKKSAPNPNKKPLKVLELCNGPSKLCIALSISRDSCNKLDMTGDPGLWVEPDVTDPHGGRVADDRVVVTKRIGIESAGPEWANKPLRFYVLGCASVSRRDKHAEKEMCHNLSLKT